MTSDPKAIATALLFGTAIVAVGIGTVKAIDSANGAADPAPVVSAARAVEAAPPVPDSITRDGVYVAGRQIKTGTYTAKGGSFCYWARLKFTAASGTTSVLVSSYVPGLQVVSIVAGDIFQTSGCGNWKPVR